MTMLYLGRGICTDSKEELKVFQQTCGGENMCVYKGYLHSGEQETEAETRKENKEHPSKDELWDVKRNSNGNDEEREKKRELMFGYDVDLFSTDGSYHERYKRVDQCHAQYTGIINSHDNLLDKQNLFNEDDPYQALPNASTNEGFSGQGSIDNDINPSRLQHDELHVDEETKNGPPCSELIHGASDSEATGCVNMDEEEVIKLLMSREVQETTEYLQKQVGDMVAVLEACDIVEHLVLRNTGLTDDLLGSLATALMNSQSEVEMINLNLNNIGPQGACILTHLLKAKPQVKGLLLFGNKLGDDGICILINRMTELHIPEENEKQISVSPLPAENEQSLSEGKGFLLSELDIGGNQITCKGIKCVASFIRQQPPLQYLGIAQSNGVDTEGWEALFDSLKINSRISHVILDENQLGDEGAILFADMLRANQSLCKVDLDWNGIGEEGGNAILESLQSRIGCSLEHLSLEGNMISEELLKKISQQLKPRSTLSWFLKILLF
ncbi:UNVERIFIED_CONTAM: hypothetical protein FKN15_049074 [Acipenser sinensis]